MATLHYGSVEIPIQDPNSIPFLQNQIGDILALGGGWLSLDGTNDDTGEPEVVTMLVQPGVPIAIVAEGTVESIGIRYDERRDEQ